MPSRSEEYEIVLKARDELGKVLKAIGPEALKAGREAKRSLGLVDRALDSVRRTASRTFNAVGRGLRGIGRGISRFVTPGIGQIALLVAGIAGLGGAARGATEFATAMAEVSTIVDRTTTDVEALGVAVIEQAKAFGTNELDQAKGLYQTISAGITEAGDALRFLDESTGLAVAGVATTTDSVNVLTNVLNAYGLEVEEVTRVSDVLFTTVRLGKTNLSELASGLSVAIPQAANLGVSIEELGAAIATITAGGGGSTSEAATQVAALLRGLQGRFAEVRAALQGAGKDFDLTTVRARGLVPVLQDIRDAAGSDEKILEILGRRAEALNGVLNLTGGNIERFNENLDQLQNSAGAAADALFARLDNPAARVTVAINRLRIAIGQELGNSLIRAADNAIKLAGGAERIEANFTIAAKVVGQFIGAGIEGFAKLAGRVNDFVDSIGGIERVTKVAAAAGAFAAQALQVAFLTAADQIQNLIQVLALLPQAIRSTIADLPLIGERTQEAVASELASQEASLTATIRRLEDVRVRLEEAGSSPTGRQTGLSGQSRFGLLAQQAQEAEREIERTTKRIAELQAELATAPVAPDKIFPKIQEILDSGVSGDTAQAKARLAELGKELGLVLQEGVREGAGANGGPLAGFVAAFGAAGVEAARQAGLGQAMAEAIAANVRANPGALAAFGAAAVEAVRQGNPGGRFAQVFSQQASESFSAGQNPVVALIEGALAAARDFQGFPLNLVSPVELALLQEVQEFTAGIERQALRTSEERLAFVERENELRQQGIAIRGRELGISEDEIARLQEVSNTIRDIEVDRVLEFVSAETELARAIARVTPTAEEQEAAIRALVDADLARIDTLEETGRVSKEVADQLRELTLRWGEEAEASAESGAQARQTKSDFARLGEGIGRDLNRQLAGVITRTRDTSEAWRAMLLSIAEDIASFAIDGLADQLFGDTQLGQFFGAGSSDQPEPVRTEDVAVSGQAALGGLENAGFEASVALETAGASAGTAISGGATTASAALDAASGALTGGATALSTAAGAVTSSGGAITTGATALTTAAGAVSTAAAAISVAAGKLAIAGAAAGGAGGGAGGAGGAVTGALTGATAFLAEGGIVPGGLGQLVSAGSALAKRAGVGFVTAARGTVVSGAHLAVIGEGKNDEAVVPLPDNRSIPVKFTNGGGGGGDTIIHETTNYYVDAIDQRSFDERLSQHHRTIGAITEQKMARHRGMRAGVKNASRGIG